jgi:imidazolonepropionase
MEEVDLIVQNASELLTLAGPSVPRRGEDLSELGIIEGGAVACTGETLRAVGTTEDILSRFTAKRVIDASGGVVMPGFVDPHTHPVFARTRELEFEMRIRGASYEEIARAGGGILNSVESLRRASREELREATRERLDLFLAYGTTTVEAKSGYGLTLKDEIKSLEVLKDLGAEHPLDIVPTFLGAHEIPLEYRENRQAYVEKVAQEMIPEVARQGLAAYCDVFCERGVFTAEESREILEAARRAGMGLRIHADEFSASGGSLLAGELGAATADHLVAIDEAGLGALERGGVTAVLLPGTSFYLGLDHDAPARTMIERGIPVALSTDFNPGSSVTHSMQLILTLACVRLRMTPAEALSAATINAAYTLDRQGAVGTLEEGKLADLLVLTAPNHRYIPYHFGGNHVRWTVKKGRVYPEEPGRFHVTRES